MTFNENDVQKVVLKTEQSLRILQKLWDERIDILYHYFKERKGLRFFLLKKTPATREKLVIILQQLRNTHEHEQKIVEILIRGSEEAMIILNQAEHIPSEQAEIMTGIAKSQYVNTIRDARAFIESYRRFIPLQQRFLELERELLNDYSEEKMNNYLDKMKDLANEMSLLVQKHQMVQSRKEFVRDMSTALVNYRMIMDKKGPSAFVAPSIVSALSRVFIANIVAATTMHNNPLSKPDFWELTSKTAALVFFINFIDYYYNVFTVMSSNIVRFLKTPFVSKG